MKAKYVLGVIALAICVGVGIFSLRSSLTPYVSFGEAMKTQRNVQVVGSLIVGTTKFDKPSAEYRFQLKDPKGEMMLVGTAAQLPANFEQSTTVVAIGMWDGSEFKASNILVKCPSKYEKEESGLKQHPGDIPK